MRSALSFLTLVAASMVVSAGPLISHRGIVNTASFMQAGLPAGSIARGSLFTIFGARLGPSSSPPATFPLSTSLAGVTIQVTQGTTTVAAIPTFVSPGQIDAVMPSTAPLGAVSIYVTYNSVASPPEPASVVTDSVGIFSLDGSGIGPGAMQNFVSTTNMPINLPSVPAKPNQTVVLFATGLGAGLNADTAPPQSGNLPTKVEVFVGGQVASVAYSGRSPCCSGLDQINFTIPANAPLGCWVPLQVRTSGTTVSNTVTLAISADGSSCSDSANALTAPFLAGKKIGLIGLLRTDITEDVGLKTAGEITTDTSMVTFQQESPAPPAPFNSVISLPPLNSCTVYTAPGDVLNGDPIPGSDDPGARFLNAGSSLTISNSGAQRTSERPSYNTRNFQPLGFTYTGSLLASTLLFNPGATSITSSGGTDVGAFNVSITLPNPLGLTWTNRNQAEIIVRSQGFTVNWTGAPAGQSVIIFGGGVDLPTNSSAIFACVAPAAASSFTIPAQILASMPATRTNLLRSKDAIYVGALATANPATFTASGLDVGALVGGTFIGKTVIFQ